MANAGKTVYVELVAQTKKFNAGMQQANKGLGKLRATVGAASGAILALGAVALRSISNEISEMSKELDTLAKTAKALDVSFAFLEDMQFVFKRLGGDGGPATLSKMFKSLEKAAGEAASGSKEYVDTFATLGLDAQAFADLKPEEQVLAVHRAWQSSNKTTEQAAAMGDLLGRGWINNRAVFAASSAEFEELIAKRRELGGFTAEAGALAEQFEDVKTNTEQSIRALKNDIFLALAPTFKESAEQLSKFVSWLVKTGHAGTVVQAVVLGITVAMGAAAMALVALLVPLAVAAAPFLAIGAAVTAAIAGIGTLIYYWDDLKRSIRDFGDVAGPILDKVTNFGGEVLSFLGLGDNSAMAESSAAPARSRGRANSGQGPAAAPTVNNYYSIEGQTAEQMQRNADRRTNAQLRGGRR